MTSFLQSFFLTLVLAGQCLAAASSDPPQTPIGAPTLGYVYDGTSQGLRPVWGTPGASIIGEPLHLGLAIASAVVSPKQDFAVILGSDDLLVRVLSLQAGNPGSNLLELAASGPGQILLSPSGEALGLYQQGLAKLQIFTHMAQQPVLAYEVDTTALNGGLTSAAISDDGELALILAGSPENPTAWISAGGADPIPLQVPASPAAVSFGRGRHGAVLATRDGQVLLLHDLETSPASRLLSPPDDRTADPVAVQFSPDGTRVYVATRSGTVAAFGIQDGSATFISCGCTPTGLFPLHSPTLFRLSDLTGGPLMLLDTGNSGLLRFWFVPAVVPAAVFEGGAQ